MTPYEQARQWLLDNLERVAQALFPAGKRDGNSFVAGNVEGQGGKSFSIALEPETKRGLYKDFATGERASRDVVGLWKRCRDIPKDDHARFFQDLSSFAGISFGYNGHSAKGGGPKEIDWKACLAAFKLTDALRLAKHLKRQYQPGTIYWLHQEDLIGKYNARIAFAMRSSAGVVTGVHRWIEEEGKLKFLGSPTLFAFGDSQSVKEVHINESTWDQIALADRTGWHLEGGILFLCTRGAPNARLIKGQIPPGAKVYIWEQHDKPNRDGAPSPNECWRSKVAELAGCPIYLVRIPSEHKDLNEWTIAGASLADLVAARASAELYVPPLAQPETTRPTGDLPEIEWPSDNRLISEFARELGKILAPQELFRRFDKCVCPRRDEKGQITLSEVTNQELRTAIEPYCVPFLWRKTGIQRQKIYRSITAEDAKATLSAREFLEQLRAVRTFNLVRLPAIYERGEVRLLPSGYDAFHQAYTDSGALDYPQDMTIEAARFFWEKLLEEFCLVPQERERSTSVILAAALTLYCVHLLPRFSIRPNFLSSSNSEGSGKTLLCKIPIIAMLGYAPAGTVPKDDDETRKLIGAAALSGSPVLFIDNVKGHLNSPAIESLSTSPVTQFRLLGQSKLLEAEHGLTVFISANNATFSPDLRRRTLVTELFLAEVRPEHRLIHHPLDDAVLVKLRPELLGSLWAFVRYYVSAGLPRPKSVNQSFIAWSNLIGGVIECAGYASPCLEPSASLFGGDRTLVDMEALVENMVEGTSYEFPNLAALARHHRLFEWLIGDAEELDPKQRSGFGKLLKRFTGRLFENHYRFELLTNTDRKKYGIVKLG